MREVDIHKRLKHKNIIKLYASCEDSEFIYLILEYAEKGNLFFFIRNNKQRLSESQAYHYFIQTCSGIHFLHQNGFIHRDIKPTNILMNDSIPKIADFGFSKLERPDVNQRYYNVGTP